MAVRIARLLAGCTLMGCGCHSDSQSECHANEGMQGCPAESEASGTTWGVEAETLYSTSGSLTSGISSDRSSGVTGSQCANWWDQAWKTRLELTVDWYPADPPDDATDVPILVRLDPARFDYDRARLDGLDLRFADASGDELVYEVEAWEHGADSLVWVKLPTLQGRGQRFYLYFDNVAAIAPVFEDSVWSHGYVAVLHMGEPIADATKSSQPQVQDTFLSAGKIGLARRFPTESAQLQIDAAESIDGLFASGLSLAGWLKLDRIAERQIVMAKGNDPYDTSSGYMLWADFERFTLHYHTPEDVRYHWRVEGLEHDQWHWFALSYDPDDPERSFITLDEKTVGLDEEGGDPMSMVSDAGYPLLLAPAGTGAGYNMLGEIDEFRVAATARSLGWMLVQRRSMNDQLLEYGELQSLNGC